MPEANRLELSRGPALGTDCVVVRANVGMATFARLVVNTQEAILKLTRWQSNRRDGTPDAVKTSNPNLNMGIFGNVYLGRMYVWVE